MFPSTGKRLCLIWMEYFDFNKKQEELDQEVTTNTIEDKLKEMDDMLYYNLKEKVDSLKSKQIE
jgi:hypothetical protein